MIIEVNKNITQNGDSSPEVKRLLESQVTIEH